MAQVPCVIVDVMRGGPSTGLPTEPSQGDVMQARWGTHGEHSMIALVPSSVLECYTLTVEAFNLSERFRTPVIILSDALVGHMREAVTLPSASELRVAERGEPDCEPEDYDTMVSSLDNILPRPPLGSRFRVHVTGLVYNRRSGAPETGDPEVARDLGQLPAREDLPPPRRHRAGGGVRDGGRRGRHLRVRLRGALGARRRALGARARACR